MIQGIAETFWVDLADLDSEIRRIEDEHGSRVSILDHDGQGMAQLAILEEWRDE